MKRIMTVAAMIFSISLMCPLFAANLLQDCTSVTTCIIGKASSKETQPACKSYTGPKKRLGVMDMDVKVTAVGSTEPTVTGGTTTTTTIYIPPPNDFGTGLTEMLTTSLIESGRFIVLERKALADIQAEHALNASGSVDPMAAVTGGKLLGAQALIRGAVTEYSYKRSSTGGGINVLKGLGIAACQAEAMVALDIRIYDVATGVILDSVRAEGKAKSSAASLTIDKEELKMDANTFKSSPLGKASREAINKAVDAIIKRMEVIPWEGRIAEIDNDDAGNVSAIYINAGSELGLKPGMRLEILQPGKPIYDPETRLVIGRTKDKHLGSGIIDTVSKKLSTAAPIEGGGYQVNDIVRMMEEVKTSNSSTNSSLPTAN